MQGRVRRREGQPGQTKEQHMSGSNVASFGAGVLQRQLQGTYWCTSRNPERKDWRRASFFGEDAQKMHDNLQALARRQHLPPNEAMLSVEEGGRVVVRLSPHAADRLNIQSTHVLPKGEAYSQYVDALMGALPQEMTQDARNDLIFIHGTVRNNYNFAAEPPVNSAIHAGKALRAVFLNHVHTQGMPPARQEKALESLLFQARHEALYRRFPEEIQAERGQAAEPPQR